MRSTSNYPLLSTLLAAVSFFSATHALAPIDLGLAEPYAILAGSTVTSTGMIGTVVTGNVGIFPGSAMTGFPPGVLNGAFDSANGASGSAQGSLTTAYNMAASLPFNTTMSNIDLGGKILFPGVYKFDAAAAMNGMLTLDARGDAAAVWVFQIGSSLMVGEGSSVIFKDSLGNPDYVYWQVGTSATLAIGVPMVGNIMALASIVVNDGVVVKGRCLARNAAVTLDNSVITMPIKAVFSATQTISGVSLTQFDAAPTVGTVVLKTAIASTMTGVLPSDIQDFEVTSGPTTAVNGKSRALSTRSIILNYLVSASSTMTSEQLRAQLTAAVEDGTFDTYLHAAATTYGASFLASSSSSSIETHAVDSSSDSSSSDKDTLSGGAIAGIVIGGFVGLLLIATMVFVFFSCNKAAAHQASEVSMTEV